MTMSKLPLRVVFVVFLTCLLVFPSLSQETWHHGGPVGAKARTILISPHDTTLVIVGVEQSGVYRSEDGGNTWVWSGNGLPYVDEGIRDGIRQSGTYGEPVCLYADPVNTDRLWYLNEYENHPEHVLFRSDNRGEYWERVDFPTDYEIFPQAIWVHPERPDTVLVGAWRSTDGGQSWTLMGAIGTEILYYYYQDPNVPEKVYMASWNNFLDYSIDGGETWHAHSDLSGNLSFALAIDPDNSNRMLSLCSNRGDIYLARTNDGGAFWYDIVLDVEQWIAPDYFPMELYENGQGNVFIVTLYYGVERYKYYKSLDFGYNWELIQGIDEMTPVHEAMDRLAINPHNPFTLFFVQYNKLLLSHNGGTTFDSTGQGMDNYNCYLLMQKPGTEEVRVEQGTGYLSWSLADSAWAFVDDPTLSEYFHPVYPDTQYAWHYGIGQEISYDDGETWTPFGYDQAFDPRFDPFDPEHILGLGYEALVNLTDYGITMIDSVVFMQYNEGECICDAQFDPTLEGRIFAGGSDHIFRSLDGGSSYQAVYTLPEESDGLFNIVVHPSDGTIYAVEYYHVPNGVTHSRILRSDDHGDSFYEPDTTFCFEVLPHLAFSPVAPHPLVMAATSGVWYQPYGTDTWNLLPLPVNVRANYLLFSWDESTLHIGTAGRGVWSLTGFDFNSVEEQELHLLPSQLDLSAYPNPFNPSVTLTYAVPQRGDVTLTVYNVLGECVAQLVNGPLAAGVHEVTWNGLNSVGQQVASGVYYATLKANGATMTQKVVMVQ